MTRRAGWFVLALASAVALSGCVRVHADLAVHDDNTVDGTYVIALEEGSGAYFGSSDAEAAHSLFEDSGLQTDYLHAREHGYAEGGFAGTQVDFRDEPLATFAPTAGRFGITREGDEFVVSGPAPSTSADDADQLEGADMTITISFPGPVAETNGTVDGTTVTWDLVGGPETLEARASAIAPSSPWPAIAATAIVGLGAALAWWPRAPRGARGAPAKAPAARSSRSRPAPARRSVPR